MIYMIYCTDAEDGDALREKVYDAHREHLGRIKDQLMLGGPCPSGNGEARQGSLLVVEADDVAAARADRAIADALDRYRAAYEQLDGAALQAVYPSVPQDTIDALQGWEAYAVVLDDVATQINGDLATVNGRVSLRLRARTGISTEASGRVVFRLEKQGQTDWLITDIDMSDVR